MSTINAKNMAGGKRMAEDRKERLPYDPPRITSEEVFETTALFHCLKVSCDIEENIHNSS